MQELLRGGLRKETLQLSHLEGAISDMQYSFRVRNRFKQLAMLVIARATPVSELHGLRELFESLDVDNSGQLSLDELRKGLKRMDGGVRTVLFPSLHFRFFFKSHEGNLSLPVARGDYLQFHVYCAQQWQAGKYLSSGVTTKFPHTNSEILDIQ